MLYEFICGKCKQKFVAEITSGCHKKFCQECLRLIIVQRSRLYRLRMLSENPALYKRRSKISNTREKQKHIVLGDWKLIERQRILKCRHSITIAEYDWLLSKQNGACALCGQKDLTNGPKNGRLHVDHDHQHLHDLKSRKSCKECIRGLLCDGCNYRCLPWAEKDVELQGPKIRDYLQRRPFLETDLTPYEGVGAHETRKG